jgi:cell division protein FtsQ
MRLRRKLACAVLVLLVGYGAWIGLVRHLSVFQVRNVTVSGLSGNAAPQIRSALELTARGMTTTDVSLGRLRAAVASYTLVAGLRVSSEYPHGLRIRVIERRPFVRLDVAGAIVAVARNDSVLAGLRASRRLPLVRSGRTPIRGRVSDPLARLEIALLADGPSPLLAHVYSITDGSHGLTVKLRRGPEIYFGDDALPHAKWASAVAVLANATSRGASYIDVSLPSRPAAQLDDPASINVPSVPVTTPTTGTTLYD